MRKSFLLLTILFTSISFNTQAQSLTKKEKKAEKTFIKYADETLSLMKQASDEMKVSGVAMIFFIPGETTQSWVSKMKVCGKMTNEKANFLAIASSKASEMAETFKNSGSKIREPKKGELGWKGGIIKQVDSGYILATFSGATGEQDAEISTKGLEWLSTKL